jgi:hypothetical protein
MPILTTKIDLYWQTKGQNDRFFLIFQSLDLIRPRTPPSSYLWHRKMDSGRRPLPSRLPQQHKDDAGDVGDREQQDLYCNHHLSTSCESVRIMLIMADAAKTSADRQAPNDMFKK